MVATGINLFTTNWRWTGNNVPTPQARVDVRLEWMGDDGQPHEWKGTLAFPNDLQDVPIAWVKDALTDLMIRAARVKLGVDAVED